MTLNSIYREQWRNGWNSGEQRREAIRDLWCSFECLVGKDMSGPEGSWDTERIAYRMGVWSTGEQVCARFVLSVWNPRVFKFELQDMSSLSEGNRLAMVDWMLNPWWP